MLAALAMVVPGPVPMLSSLLTMNAAAAGGTAGGSNSTIQAPPPVVNGTAQLPVGPGSVTRADGSAAQQVASLPSGPHVPLSIGNTSSEITVATSFGTFAASDTTPWFVDLNGRGGLAEVSGFTVVVAGTTVLTPSSGSLARLSSGFEATYSLSDAGSTRGTMSVFYNFTETDDKVTAVFSPCAGAPSRYSVLWLGFTPLTTVQTMSMGDPDTPFAAIGLGFYAFSTARTLGTDLGNLSEIGNPDWNLTVGDDSQMEVAMGYADAAEAYNGSFASDNGSFSFAGMAGNAVAVSFVPGVLAIDPQLAISESHAGGLYAAGERKMLSDGSVDWLFYYNSGSINYLYSSGGGWTYGGSVPGVGTGMDIADGFAVARLGSTVNVLFVNNNTVPNPALVYMVSGIISDQSGSPHITWYSSGSAELFADVTTFGLNGIANWLGPKPGVEVVRPIDAVYSGNGQLVVTLIVRASSGAATEDHAVVDRLYCNDAFCSVAKSAGGLWVDASYLVQNGMPYYYSATAAFTVPYQNSVGATMTFWSSPSDTYIWGYEQVNILQGLNGLFYTMTPPMECGLRQAAGWPSGTTSIQGLFVAAPTGTTNVELFYPATSGGAYTGMYAYNITLGDMTVTPGYPYCRASKDSKVTAGLSPISSPYEPTELTASGEWDGNSIDLVYSYGGWIGHARAMPFLGATVDAPGTGVIPWSLNSAYQSPNNLNAASGSSHFIIGSFERGTSVYAFEVPIPSDVSAGPNDPWVQLPGGAGISEGGSSVNPATGMLTYTMPLVSTPVPGATESLSLVYREPGLFYGAAASPAILSDASPYDSGFTSYGFFEQSTTYLNLPWLDLSRGVLHLGLYSFDIQWTSPAATARWFNNTRGISFKLTYLPNGRGDIAAPLYALYTADGSTMLFDANSSHQYVGGISELANPAGTITLSFAYDSNGNLFRIAAGGIAQPNSGAPDITINYVGGSGACMHEISAITYEQMARFPGKTVSFSYPTGASNCAQGNSQVLKITDAAGRVTTLGFAFGKLQGVSLPTGGNLSFAYASPNYMWNDSTTNAGDIFSLPVTNEWTNTTSSAIERQRQFTYIYQDQSVIESDVKTANSAGVWQGETQYRFRSDHSLTTTRSIDYSARGLYYNMATTGTVSDLSGNQVTGTEHGFPTPPAITGGVIGQALSFPDANLSNDWIGTATNPPSISTPTISVSLWFEVPNAWWAAQNMMLLSDWNCQNPGKGYVLEYVGAGSQLAWTVGTGGPSNSYGVTYSSWRATPNTWYQVGGTYDGSTLTLYLNGVQVGTQLRVSTTSILPIAYGSDDYLALGDHSTCGSLFFQGNMDEVQVYGRALSSDEMASLYYDNAVQTGIKQDWWAYNAQPNVEDTLLGYNTTASAGTASQYVDEWGNIIYTRDALGNERFYSYNNTNYQQSLYAPGRLQLTSSGTVYASGFDYGSSVDLSVSKAMGTSYPAFDRSGGGDYAPSLRLSTGVAPSDLRLTRSATTSTNWLQSVMHVMIDDTSSNSFYYNVTTSTYTWSVRLTGGQVWAGGTNCGATYSQGQWNTLMLITANLNSAFPAGSVYWNGAPLGSCFWTASGSETLQSFSFEAVNHAASAWSVWVDDVALTTYPFVYVAGLVKGQVAQLIGPDGTVLNSAESTGGTVSLAIPYKSGATVPPSEEFNEAGFGNVRIAIYNTDGTLDYLSPRSDFYGGSTYQYYASRTVSRLIETRTGFDYYSTTAIRGSADDTSVCQDSTQYGVVVPCPAWNALFGIPPPSGTTMSQPLGPTQETLAEWDTPNVHPSYSASSYLVQYVYFNATTPPSRVALGVNDSADWGITSLDFADWGIGYGGPCTKGSASSPGCPWWLTSTLLAGNARHQRDMGPFPAYYTPGMLMKFIVRESDLMAGDSLSTIPQFYTEVANGQAYFDGTSIGPSDSGNVSVAIPAGTQYGYLAAYWAGNDTMIPHSEVPAAGTTVIPLYPVVSAFPLSIRIKVLNDPSGTGIAPGVFFASNVLTVWGGEKYTFQNGNFIAGGLTPWFDTYLPTIYPYPTATPKSSVHTGLLASYAPHGDCTTAALCFDLGALYQSTQSMLYDGTGTVYGQVPDLSGNGNAATSYGPSPAMGINGMALSFDGSGNQYLSVPSSSSLNIQGSLTLAAWVKFSSLPNDNQASTVIRRFDVDGGNHGYILDVGDLQSSYAGKLRLYIGGSSSSGAAYSASTLSANTWYFAVGVLDTSVQKAYIYVNGALSSTTSMTMSPASNSQPLGVAKQLQSGHPASPWSGVIDRPQVYAFAAKSQQVMGLYMSRLPNSLATYYHPREFGLPDRDHAVFNGTFSEREYSYDGYLRVLTSALNGNTTTYQYSSLDAGASPTESVRPDSSGDVSYSAYDSSSGRLVSTLDVYCRQTRYAYDPLGRAVQIASYDSDAGTVLYLDMQTVTGSTLKDVSCNVADGGVSMVGVFTFAPGPSALASKALYFNGGYIYASPAGLPTGGSPRTLSAWVQTTATSEFILGYGTSGSGAGGYLEVSSSGELQFEYGGDVEVFSTLPAIDDGQWHYVSLVVLDSNHIRAQVDGSISATVILSTAINTASSPVLVGEAYGLGFFTGSIDEVRVFNYAQNTSVVAAVRDLTYGRLASSTSAYDDSALPSVTTYSGDSVPRSLYLDMSTARVGQPSSVLEDLSGNGNNAANHGATPTSGKMGGAYGFTNNAFMQVTDAPELDTIHFSVAVWLYPTYFGTAWNRTIAHDYFGASNHYGWVILYNANAPLGRLYMAVMNGGTTSEGDSQMVQLSLNTWNHVVFTFDGGNICAYLNGAAVGACTSMVGTYVPASGSNLFLGGGDNAYYTGKIDEVQVIPQALTSTQVSALYSGYTAGSTYLDPTHLSRIYYNGLSQANREVTMDLYGNVLITSQTLAWDGLTAQDNQTDGYYSTYSHRYEGSVYYAVGPAVTTPVTTTTLGYPAQLKTVSFDGDLHQSYTQSDILGRTVRAGVYNASGGNYNYTATTYDGVGLAVSSTTYHGSTADWAFSAYYNALGMPVVQVNPDGSLALTVYDKDLRVAETIDAMGRVAAYSYVSTSNTPGYKLGWLANVALRSNGPSTTCYASVYAYDYMGDVTQVTNGTAQSCGSNTLSRADATVTRDYDHLYRLKDETVAVAGAPPLMTAYSYDAAGRVTAVGYPLGQGTAGYIYDTLGRVSAVTWNATQTPYVVPKYDAYGRMNNLTYPQSGNWYQSFGFDAMNRLATQNLCPPTGPGGGCSLSFGGYTYDAAGMLTAVTSDNMGYGVRSFTFKYDGNGRLARASGPFSTKPLQGNGDQQMAWQNFTYDAEGDIRTLQSSDTGFTQTFSYGMWGELSAATYNADGSTLAMPAGTGASTGTYAFDFSQHLTCANSGVIVSCLNPGRTTSHFYGYDGFGRKVSETVDAGGTTTVQYDYAYLGPTLSFQLETVSHVASSYVYLGNRLLFRVDSSGTAKVHYYLQDDHGDLREVWSYASGTFTVEGKYRYQPYGLEATPNAVPGVDPRFTYAGQSYASDTGLYHMAAREYDPVGGRFLSRDPPGPGGYGYADDNPVAFVDPSGLDAVDVLRDEAPARLAGIATAVDVGNGVTVPVMTWVSPEGDVVGTSPGIPADATGLGEDTGIVTAPAAQVQVALETSGIASATGNEATAVSEQEPPAVPPGVTEPYERPSGATTREQRASVQGQPCVDCGQTDTKMYADHKTPLVVEYYTTGSIDEGRMRSIDAVQPQCPTCSNIQGGELSQYSRQMRGLLGL